MLDWGYDRGYPKELVANGYYANDQSGSYRMPGDPWNVLRKFSDPDDISAVESDMESFGMAFTSPTGRVTGFEWSSFSKTDRPLEAHHSKKWGGGFCDIDLALSWAMDYTHPNNHNQKDYYTMEEVLTTYNLIKKIFLDAGFQFATAFSKDHYFCFGDQHSESVGYDRLMRLDRIGVNRLIAPYEECRRIEMKDIGIDSAKPWLPDKGIIEYHHFVPLNIIKPPYHVE